MYIVSVPTPYDKFSKKVDACYVVGDYPQLAKVIDESMKTNDYQPAFVLERIHEIMEAHGITDNRRVGLYGFTYKENVDDIRESPTLQMLDFDQFLSEVRYCHQLQKDSCRAGL